MLSIRKLVTAGSVCLGLLGGGAVSASSKFTDNMGVGLQTSWPASHGVSVKKAINDKLTAQGVLGVFGTISNYSVRGLYTLKEKEDFDVYAYGSVGLYVYDYWGGDESVFGVGGGAGIEYDLSKPLDGMPLTVSGEIGLGLVNFDHYNYGAVGVGVGLHYWFE